MFSASIDAVTSMQKLRRNFDDSETTIASNTKNDSDTAGELRQIHPLAMKM